MTEAVPGTEPAGVIRPVVALGTQGNLTMWAFLVLLAIGCVFLFNALNTAEETAQVPAVTGFGDAPTVRIASPAPLSIPPGFARAAEPPANDAELARPRSSALRDEQVAVPPPQDPAPRRGTAPVMPLPLPPPDLRRDRETGPTVVFRRRRDSATPAITGRPSNDRSRVTASRFLNPGMTIPQGTVIQAVLETALDSSRPGGVRALVQHDVSSFDGVRVLVPRGSRLYGEYEANLQQGQKRALVQWTRLIRPDGVTIALDSPSSDPLGRAGIKGKVDTKFLQRFGGAILQSVLDIGVGLAVNEASDGVIVALPGSTQNVRISEPDAIVPTLKVKHGASVSVFVARDLDFSTVES